MLADTDSRRAPFTEHPGVGKSHHAREWQDVLRISEDLRLAVCFILSDAFLMQEALPSQNLEIAMAIMAFAGRIQAKLASERPG